MTEPEIATPPKYRRKTDDEIAELAKRVYRHLTFVSWMMDNPQDLPMVFMPILFLDEATRRQMIDDEIHFFYEDYDKAGPTSVNGMPCFTSFRTLSREDGYRLLDKVRQIEALVG